MRGVVACLLLSGGLSSLRSWLCQHMVNAMAVVCVAKKEILSCLERFQEKISVIVHKLHRKGFFKLRFL